jgi:hypothetical protein
VNPLWRRHWPRRWPAPGCAAFHCGSCWLGGALGEAAATIVGRGERIVQEHVGVEVLANADLSDWFDVPPRSVSNNDT